jgi:hypothetical protein
MSDEQKEPTQKMVRIDVDQMERLQEERERTGVSVAEQIRRAIRAWLRGKGHDGEST